MERGRVRKALDGARAARLRVARALIPKRLLGRCPRCGYTLSGAEVDAAGRIACGECGRSYAASYAEIVAWSRGVAAQKKREAAGRPPAS